MNYRKNDKSKKIISYAIPFVVTVLGVMLVMLLKGIWPFGAARIDYFDNMQQVAPLYNNLWDAMHGDAAAFFDWSTGLGTNLSMSISAFSMFSPFNLLLYLTPRAYILEFISILTIVKMGCMAATMYFFFNHCRGFGCTSYGMKSVFSVMYAFCGYSLLYGSCFTPWMDMLVFFPLLMLAFYKMMYTGKKLFYIIMLGICFITNYYLSAMAVLYIFLLSGAYLLLFSECEEQKEKRGSRWSCFIGKVRASGAAAWNVGVGTVAGMGLSAVVLVPVFMQLSTSQRGGGESTGLLTQYLNMIQQGMPSGGLGTFQRWMMLYGSAFAIVMIILGVKYCTEKKQTIYNLLCLGFVVTPLLFEGIGLIWHFGSYNGYSARFGFVICFTLIASGAFFAGKPLVYDKKTKTRQKIDAKFDSLEKLVYLLASAVVCGILAYFYNRFPVQTEYQALIAFAILFVVLVAAELVACIMNQGVFCAKSCFVLIVVELFMGAYALIGAPSFYQMEPYQYGDYVEVTNKVKSELHIQESDLERIKNPDVSLNSNYPLVMGRAALSSFTAALQKDTQHEAWKWGYSRYFLWLLDSGGTVFSDALLNVTEAVNIDSLDSGLYTLKRTNGEYSLYNARYQLPFGMTVPSQLMDVDLKDANWIDLHNTFYTALSLDSDDLAYNINAIPKLEGNRVTYEVPVFQKSALYMSIADANAPEMDANASILNHGAEIYVNGKSVKIPTIGDSDNTKAIDDYNNNLICLGTFEEEQVTIQVIFEAQTLEEYADITLGGIRLDKLENLCENYSHAAGNISRGDAATFDIRSNYHAASSYSNDGNSMELTVIGTPERDMVLLPVIYSDGWSVQVNGHKANATEVGGLFMGVILEDGENHITLTFIPKGLMAGLWITLADLLLVIGFACTKRFVKYQVPAFCTITAGWALQILWYVAMAVMFVIPIVYGIVVVYIGGLF